MNRTITIDVLDPASVNAAARELREYAKRVQSKTEELRLRIAELIKDKVEPVFQSAIVDDTFWVIDKADKDDKGSPESPIRGNVSVTVEPGGENVTLVIADGEDAVWIEFGAGVHHNGPAGSYPNPLAEQLGYISAIGTYGEGRGARETWGFRGKDGKIHLTHGAPASMPLYKAVTEIRNDIERIAREVFSG